jgi:hypothetical protein
MTNTSKNNNESTMNTSLNLDNFEKTMNLLENTGLNWSVRKEPLHHSSGSPTDFYGVFKYANEDSETPLACFGAVKDRYRVFPNWKLADTIVRATEGIGITTDRGGELNNGAKVYLQSQLPDEQVGKSDVKRWVTVLNSHDGSASIGFGSTNMVVQCSNTFYKSYADVEKFRHTESADARIELAIQKFHETITADKVMFEKFHRMSESAPNENLVETIINRMFKIDVKNSKREDVSTRKVNQIQQFASAYSIERELAGDTVWGLFNAVTRYTNHIAAPNKDKKDSYLMIGQGREINNMAYDTILDWLSERTTKTVLVK